MENMDVNQLFIMVPSIEAVELMEKDGFWTNSYPRRDDDGQTLYWFIDFNWYNSVNYRDYVTSISK